MATPPQMSEEQRAAALVKAAEARRARAELKERLKTGSLNLSGVFEAATTDEVVGKTKILAVLEALPGVGKVTARRALEELEIADNRRVQGLGTQQKVKLLEYFAR
jgi:hypothetical protein